METKLLTRYRVFRLVFEPSVHDHGSMWTYKPVHGEENHEFDSESEALEWVQDNPEIMIKCREFVILPVYHLVLA